MKKINIAILALIVFFAAGTILAQEKDSTVDVTQELELDENVQAEDLGITEPTLLPDSPFYFLKNWSRKIQSFLTFDPVKKAELKLKFANEKLIESKKLAEKEKKSEIIEKGLKNYQKEIEEMKTAVERIKKKTTKSIKIDSFLDKFTQQQMLHQRILQKLETQVPSQAIEKIAKTREKHLESFAEVMTKLEENNEQLKERLEKNLQKVKGSEFKDLKNLEILKKLEEKVPAETKEVIQKVRANTLKNLKETFEEMPVQKQKKFQEYIEKVSGEKEKQMEIIDNLKQELKEIPAIKEILLESRHKVLEQIREKTQERQCPEIEKPAFNFCQEGRIITKKDKKGCITSFECLIPAEIENKPQVEEPTACITVWDPVCGKDGKTYSNTCFARVAGVEIDYKGVCKEKMGIQQ